MSDDVVFGEVQMAEPEKALRPDRNKHYAVVALDTPQEGELPIYIDLDVFRDIDVHAASDKTVELGGVVLGGQHHDEDGKPFVVITDSLRAQHYESTKGSFKFTHETWSAISRERDEFPPECQMVGWYHTHPDWGVFLSGMDLFICNNFFNKPLDVAYVVDPCRQDRGMFQWTGGRKNVTRRTGGFYLIASRFRQEELEEYVAALKGEVPMPTVHDRGATVVNLHGQQPQWMGPAVLGMLSLQFCLLALIAWKMLEKPAAPVTPEMTAALAEKRAAELERVRTETLDAVVTKLDPTTPKGYATSLQKQKEEAQKLAQELSLAKEIAALRDKERKAAELDLEDAKQAKETLAEALETMKGKRDKLSERLIAIDKTAKEEAAAADKEGGDKKETSRTTWIVLGSGLGILAVAAALAAAMQQRSGSVSDDELNGREHDREITGTRIRPPSNSPPPAATDEAVNSIVGEPPSDARVPREE